MEPVGDNITYDTKRHYLQDETAGKGLCMSIIQNKLRLMCIIYWYKKFRQLICFKAVYLN